MKTATEAPWRKIVKHDTRSIRLYGRPFERMVDTLECGHTLYCNRWYRAGHADAAISAPHHHRRRCEPCRDGGPHIPTEDA